MRRLVVGTAPDGYSRIIGELSGEGMADTSRSSGSVVQTLFETLESLSLMGSSGREETIDLGIPLGAVRWVRVALPPGASTPVDRSDTIDLGTVTSGSIDIILDDGVHRMEEDDCVVVTGVAHGWTAGFNGCTMSVVKLGTRPAGS